MGKKKHKYPQRIDLPFKEGDWISKKNYDLFNIGWNGKKEYIAVMEVKQAFRIKDNAWVINNRYYFEDVNHLKVISKEKAEELILIYKNLKLTEPESISVDETCYTTYTGEKQEKKKEISEKRILTVLFQKIMQRPTEGFQAYKCPNCGFYHIGRVKNVTI